MQRIGGWLAALCLGLSAGMASADVFQHPGGVVTAAQIDRARSALAAGEEPWKSAWAEDPVARSEGLNEAPSAVANWYVPSYYEDPAGHEAAKKILRDDVNAAHACALVSRICHGLSPSTCQQHSAKARALINNWATVNTAVSGPPSEPSQGRLTMAVVGSAFVTTAELLSVDPAWTATDRADFSQWTDTVLRDVATMKTEPTTGEAGACSPGSPAHTGAATRRRSLSMPRACGS